MIFRERASVYEVHMGNIDKKIPSPTEQLAKGRRTDKSAKQ
jgi:hypothetical protein